VVILAEELSVAMAILTFINSSRFVYNFILYFYLLFIVQTFGAFGIMFGLHILRERIINYGKLINDIFWLVHNLNLQDGNPLDPPKSQELLEPQQQVNVLLDLINKQGQESAGEF